MRKKVITITLCFIFSVFSILILNVISEGKTYIKGGFKRLYQPLGVNLSGAYDLGENSYYIAGVTKNNIFLANQTITSKIKILSHDLKFAKEVNISVSPYKISWMGAKIKIDSPYISIIESITPSIVNGIWHPFKIFPYKANNKYYSDGLQLSPSSFILKVYDKNMKQNILVKDQIDSPYSIMSKNSLERQIDGRFCVDGMILNSSEFGKIVYVYYYRNQFLCLDTNLNLLYRSNTIDTNRYAKIKVNNVKTENIQTLSTPHLFVNKKACISGDNIFINSTQFAENDEKKKFFLSSAIDVYSLKDGLYKYSFYLPNVHDSKLVSFTIYNNNIIATFEKHYLAIFQINFKI